MIWFIIILVILYFAKFFWDSSKNDEQIQREGGMLIKYSTIVRGLLEHPDARIIDDSGNNIVIRARGINVITQFTIVHIFDKFVVLWKHESLMFGKHELKWEFPEYMNHGSALNKISSDIKDYEQIIISKML